MFRALRERGLADMVGVALPPGATFVGGSHLVVWKHSQQPEAVLQPPPY